jgi:glycosyltransferase involved in cell wall biosynthesis
MRAPKVSIITPFFAEASFLAEAIDSVRAQEFPDWELLLVDDGSLDGSRDIAARLVAWDPYRIRLLDPDPRRRGAAAARNRGIRAAAGEMVAFLDADDVFEPEKLQVEVPLLDANRDVALLYSRTRYWYPGRRARDFSERLGVAGNHVHPPPYLLTRILLQHRGDVPCICGILARRSAVLDVGGFEEDFALYEDQTLLAKLFLAYPTYVSKGCHARYRQHPDSTSARARTSGDYDPFRPHPAQDAFFDWLESYVKRHGADAGVLSAIARARIDRQRPPPGRIRLLASRLARRLRPI